MHYVRILAHTASGVCGIGHSRLGVIHSETDILVLYTGLALTVFSQC